MDLKKCPLTDEEKQSMIADVALRKSEKRGFAGGDPHSDWHSAEADLDEALNAQCKSQPQHEESAGSFRSRRAAWKILARVEEKAIKWGQHGAGLRLRPGETVEGWKGQGIRIWHLASHSIKDWMSRRRSK